MIRTNETISMSAGTMEDFGSGSGECRHLSFAVDPLSLPSPGWCSSQEVVRGDVGICGCVVVGRSSAGLADVVHNLPAVDPSSPLLACWRLFALSPRSRIYLVSGARACPLYSQIVIRFGSGKTRIGKSMGWVHGYEGLST